MRVVLVVGLVCACTESRDSPPHTQAAVTPASTQDDTTPASPSASSIATWNVVPENKPPPGYCAGNGDCTWVSGRLPPETVKRIVRLNDARFRTCYANGLHKDPTLAGRVAVKFVIDRAGEVHTAELDSTTTLAAGEVTACIIEGIKQLAFPQPEGGMVTVVYPFVFTATPKPNN